MIDKPWLGNIADPLSRLLHGGGNTDNHQLCAEEDVRFVAVNATPTALTTLKIEEALTVDEELTEVRRAIATGQFEKCKQYNYGSGQGVVCYWPACASIHTHCHSQKASTKDPLELLLMKDIWE